ncbi:PASTA domain-containing protein [Ascidiimonas sp. W6]|uniref:PASTA domain-containing protein n=1 Tax=Ascidiimonas meishanensis TaxID=3128903 RepID=UPI0030EF70EB
MSLIKFLVSKVFLKQLGLGLLAVIVLVFVTLQWLKSSTNHGDFIIVPDLSKKTASEVNQTLKDYKLRFEVSDSTNFNPKYPRFSVIQQNPIAGTKVKENRKIYLTMNPSGFRSVTVPQVIQVTRRNAESMLKAVGLEVEKVTYIDELGKDMVYYIKHKGQTIAPGKQLKKTSKVELVCGNGNKETYRQNGGENEGGSTND